jgi:predicted SAM-dependent methyltransferase
MKLLNLGCGNRYNTSWTNVDFRSTGSGVIAYDLRKGIPFEEETFDVVYHSNVIEHFGKEDAPFFIQECYRVLKNNGILRIAYPDLESLIKHYVRILNELRDGNLQYSDDYDWIMLELLDQSVRNYSGGSMLKYFIKDTIPNEEFVISRCGTEAKHLIDFGKKLYAEQTKYTPPPTHVRLKKTLRHIMDQCLKKLFGKHYIAYKIGRFRLGGEIHQWLYDSYSISKLLDFVGFKNIIIRDAFTSYIDNWSSYNLDSEPDGNIYKPDSSYIEAIKTN